MALSNRDRVGKALECLCAGVAPFAERELKAVLGLNWEGPIFDAVPKPAAGRKAIVPTLKDPQVLLAVLWNQDRKSVV